MVHRLVITRYMGAPTASSMGKATLVMTFTLRRRGDLIVISMGLLQVNVLNGERRSPILF